MPPPLSLSWLNLRKGGGSTKREGQSGSTSGCKFNRMADHSDFIFMEQKGMDPHCACLQIFTDLDQFGETYFRCIFS